MRALTRPLEFQEYSCSPALDRDSRAGGRSGSIVIVYKDGHHQTSSRLRWRASTSRLRRSCTKTATERRFRRDRPHRIRRIRNGTAVLPGRNHFIGKWEVGEGNGATVLHHSRTQRRSQEDHRRGARHMDLGRWRSAIAWDDGWHDAIRKVGTSTRRSLTSRGKISVIRLRT